jgi:hypothetical protein
LASFKRENSSSERFRASDSLSVSAWEVDGHCD